jgi:hypothetical protein
VLASIAALRRLDPKRLLMARAVAPAAAAPAPARRPQPPAPAHEGYFAVLAPATLSALIEAQEQLA